MNRRFKLFLLFFLMSIPFVCFSQIISSKTSDGVIKFYKKSNKKQTTFDLLLYSFQGYLFSESKPFDKTVAFLIGISKYDYFNELPLVNQDINRLKEFLLMKGGVDTVYIAKDAIVNPELIKRYMTDYFPKSLGTNDRLIFYFSGHADDNNGKTGYLLFKNSKKNEFWRNALAINETFEWSKVNKAKHMLFLYDCCSSGLAFINKGIEDDYEKLLSSLSGQGSRIVITAGTADQKTYDGWFTNSLINALSNNRNDIFITAHEIYSSIRNDIAKLSAQYGKLITPYICDLGSNAGTFIFVNPNKIQNKLPLELNVYLRSKSNDVDIENSISVYKDPKEFLNELAISTNKIILIVSNTRGNTSKYSWETDLLSYTLKNYFKSKGNLIYLDEYEFNYLFADSLIPEKNFSNIKRLSIHFDSIAVKKLEVETVRGSNSTQYNVNTSIIFNLSSLYNQDTDYKIISNKVASSSIKAIGQIADEYIEFLNSILFKNNLNYIPIVQKKNRSKVSINKGLDHSFYNYSVFDILDSESFKKKAIVRVSRIDRDSSEAITIYGHRLIKQGDYVFDKLKPFKGSNFINLNIGKSSFKSFLIADFVNIYEMEMNKYQLSYNHSYSIQNPNPFIGFEINVSNNRNISTFGLGFNIGLNYTLIPGYVKCGGYLNNGLYLITKQNMSDSSYSLISKYIVQESGWEFDKELFGNSALYNTLGLYVKYIFDKNEIFQLVYCFGYNNSTQVKNWEIHYYNTESQDNRNSRDEKHIKIPSQFITFPIIFQSNIFWSLGFEINLY